MALELDPVRVTQVITNVLADAAKYTLPGGLIQLGVRGAIFRHHVRDNGIGLTDESMPHVFDMFTRIESKVSLPKADRVSAWRSPKD